MIQVKEYDASDGLADSIMYLGQLMHEESRKWNKYPINLKRWWDALSVLITFDDGLALVAVDDSGECVAMLGAVAEEHQWCDLKQAREVIFYIREDHRNGFLAKRMLNYYKQWAQEHKCLRMLVGNSANLRTKRAIRFYQLMGFVVDDVQMMKDI